MADNVAITAGAGTTVATDQIPGTLEHIQVVKLADGTADSATRIPGDATNGLDVDVTRVQGNVTVIDGGGSISVDDNGSTLSVDDGGASLTIDGSVTAVGAAADDAAISGNPVPIGAKAASGPRTAVTAGDVVYPMANLQGALITHANLRENLVQQHTSIAVNTETTIVTADATYALDLYGLTIANTSATAVNVTIKDSTAGSTRMVLMVPAGDTRGFMLPSDAGHKQAAANNNWTATSSAAVSTLYVTAFTVKRT